MSILIIGGDGNMGSRYKAVLKYLGKEVLSVDKHHSEETVKEYASQCDGMIITTPTDTHLDVISKMMVYRKPMLCEKPVSKNVKRLQESLYQLRVEKIPFSMIYQYSVLDNKMWNGLSEYDYFKHGNDGIVWDCLQIIGLARGEVSLKEESPIWRCSINGSWLNIAHMDLAYISYIRNWLEHPHQDISEILDIHIKTDEMDRKWKSN